MQLDTPLVWVDTETTGTSTDLDRIVQIGVIKVHPDGSKKEHKTLVNPGCPIPPEATEVHGITDADVATAPPFRQLAAGLHKGFEGCDIGGYNVPFDMRMLEAEFKRAGLASPFQSARIVDACKVFLTRERRQLANAVKRYLNEDMVGAHDALTDIRYTQRVFEAQLKEYTDLPPTVEGLHRLFFETPPDGCVDNEGRLRWRFGEAVMNFGKHEGRRLADVEQSYLKWILEQDFEESFRLIVVDALQRKYPRRG